MALTLKQWRAVRGLSREQLALLSGVHFQTIYNVERDPLTAKVGTILKIIDALEVPIEQVIFMPFE